MLVTQDGSQEGLGDDGDDIMSGEGMDYADTEMY
jgi:hypothetical protein